VDLRGDITAHVADPVTSPIKTPGFASFPVDEPPALPGRVGELAGRAGSGPGAEKSVMVDDMREIRLGGFEQLLGQTTRYRSLDSELIQRYVCLGDDFAHILITDKTRTVRGYPPNPRPFVSAPTLPMSMCLRDTPGVNDTFSWCGKSP
jgi:hypothetical protein